jgi:hypothetical protein
MEMLLGPEGGIPSFTHPVIPWFPSMPMAMEQVAGKGEKVNP